jgi:hypothetical protein
MKMRALVASLVSVGLAVAAGYIAGKALPPPAAMHAPDEMPRFHVWRSEISGGVNFRLVFDTLDRKCHVITETMSPLSHTTSGASFGPVPCQ